MPIYDYRCGECGSTYDVLHKTREIETDVICPSCGSARAVKLMSVPAAVTRTQSAGPRQDSCALGDDCCGGVCSSN
ncbi:MAG TPA: zinc ribbon domain-containing protein [Bacteroidota bacterium]|nr:zinc ribbon domain-containing protein [Bacteroidota bacterium]